MKLEHKNITAFVDTEGTETGVHGSIVPVTLVSGNGLDKIKRIHTLIISPSSDVDAVVDLYFRFKTTEPPGFFQEAPIEGYIDSYNEGLNSSEDDKEDDEIDSPPNTEARKRGLRSSAEAIRTQSLYYVFKSLVIPKTTALDVTADFPNGIPYSTKYDLILKLGGDGQSISLILHYE